MNRTALITGGSRGIGRGIALALAAAGYDLAINYAGQAEAAERTAADCEQAAREAGHRIRTLTLQADVGLDADRQRLIAEARAGFSRLDLLVNNAGITSIGRADVLDASEEHFDRLMAINLKGPFFLSQLAARWMLEAGGAAGGPVPIRRIVNISSISGYAVSVNRADYCMAKAALGMMTRVFAARLANDGVHVFEVCPGIIESDMTAPVREKYDRLIGDGLTPIRRWGTPEDVGAAVRALADGHFPFSTGTVFHVDGGFHIRTL